MLELNSYGEKRQPANLRKNITTVFFYGGLGGVKLAEKLSFPDGKLLRLKVAI
ncbi:hypothetical protein LLF15_03320 [Escherichia coli]|nr:hypothetical protein [Escherichia coli]EIM7502619.1 hypothetical protein [Escherichia coli]EJJ5985916.1 hypothetical protein [Escherichia coli]EKI3824985.1 hypothetical protein [Escherichia coli]EKR1230370.1 hypothetical protein [Escherichia coli]